MRMMVMRYLSLSFSVSAFAGLVFFHAILLFFTIIQVQQLEIQPTGIPRHFLSRICTVKTLVKTELVLNKYCIALALVLSPCSSNRQQDGLRPGFSRNIWPIRILSPPPYHHPCPNGINDQLVQAIKTAIKVGYIHLDSARVYANEKSLGQAIAESGIDRKKLFVTTKIMTEMSSIRETLKDQLNDLKLDHVDLYLIHSSAFASQPNQPSLSETWKEMEKIRQDGLAKSIGVSNYRISDLQEILKTAKVKPAVNQIEFHPYVWKEAEPLLNFMKKEGILLEAYGAQVPVVKYPGGKVDPILEHLASTRKISTGDILLKWAKAHGGVVVTTSSKEFRMKANLQSVLDDEDDLNAHEVEQINKAGIENGVQRAFNKHMSE
ncbi:hypothetical protein O181_040772 [Austropuccinia psidii MF-1]|uniref:NADP-dependent oxidoreductase domain-containing protein n=1 Tax=Austropuccinia psidii MF-1 TaxID=1389203 RepID=A0A9Q3HE81_9BASI|nr:hypothetical protein [Austropuccinia psidii MF-1]